MAVYLNKALSLGKLRDKWYYLMNDGWKYSFYCADLDGGNEKKIGTIDHGISGNDLYYKNSCIYESTRHVYDEETKDLKYFVSALYRYNFDERKEEILISETMNIGYELYGRYKNQLVYVEKDNQKRCYTVKLLDLETGEDKNLLKNTEDFYLGDLNEQYFVYMVKMEGNKGYKIIELNLETGTEKEIGTFTGNDFPIFCWGSEMKAISFVNDAENYRKTYYYTKDGNFEQIREEAYEPYYNYFSVSNGQVIAQFLVGKKFPLKTISVKDFIAGNNNWTILQWQ